MSALHCEKCTSSGRTSTWGIWITERKTLIVSMNCVGYHCWFSSLSLFSVLILSKWNVILKLLSLYLCIWYCCCHAIQCLRHVTISLLLGSMFEIERVCARVCVCICILDIRTACIVNILYDAFCASRLNIIAFQGLPIILICWNVNFPLTLLKQ